MNILQRLALPQCSIYETEIELYLRFSDKTHLVAQILHIAPYQKVDFNTFFNNFPVKKWVDFGQIDSLFLMGGLCGTALIEIVGVRRHNGSFKEELLCSFLAGQTGECGDFIEELYNFSLYEVLFVRVCALEEKCELHSLAFSTRKVANRQVHLAVCLVDEGSKNQVVVNEINELQTHCGIDIDVINMPHKTDSKADVLTRALLRVGADRTHILSLSTKDFITAESIFRAVRFFEMVFTERQDIILTGLPISLKDDWYTNSEATFKNSAIGGSKDANKISWSFCMFDKRIIGNFGLPISLSSDASAKEFRNRTHKEVVLLSGLAYKQPSDEWEALIDCEYHRIKDSIIAELLQSQPKLSKIKQLIWGRFWYNLNTYNYVAARLNLYALDHVIKGTYQLPYEELNRLAWRLYHKENRFTKYTTKTKIDTKEPIKNTLPNRLKPYLLPISRENEVAGNRKVQDFIGRSRVLVLDQAGNIEIAHIRRRKAKKLMMHATNSIYNFIKNYRNIRLNVIRYRDASKSY